MKNPKKKKGKAAQAQKVPYHYRPHHLTTEEWQKKLRKQFAQAQSFKIKNTGGHPVYSDFSVFNPVSKNTYKVSIRNEKAGYNFCNCPDFKINQLGTCKHVEYVLFKLSNNRKVKKYFLEEYVPPYTSIFLRYGEERKVMLRIGADFRKKYENLSSRFFDDKNQLCEEAFTNIESFIKQASLISHEFRCYQDAMDYILEVREKIKRAGIINELMAEDQSCSFLDTLLKAQLFPYQKEGILFALSRTGRAGRSHTRRRRRRP